MKKVLYAEDGTTVLQSTDPHAPKYDDAEFGFEIFLGEELNTYGYGIYYMRDPEGNYCTLREGQYISLGISNFDELGDQLSDAQIETSFTGGADYIPAGYTLEIRELLPETRFKVAEQPYDIPAGYAFIEYIRLNAVGTTGTGTASYTIAGAVNDGRIKKECNAKMEVHNKRGWGLSVKKIWSDDSFMQSHDTIYVAVYLKGSTLLPGSIRQLPNGTTSVSYFFDHLEPDCQFKEISCVRSC